MLREARAGGAALIAAITGTAGVGKSALAVHWAQDVAAEFPDGQLYVNLRGFDPSCSPMEPADVVGRFLSALGGVPEQIPASPEAQAALYRSMLAGKQVLLVLDNAHDEEQVSPLLPAGPGCLAIVTSRSDLAGLAGGDGVGLLTLEVLDETEARHLLAATLGPARLAAEPEAVTELTRLCSRLPLALAIAAAGAQARPQLTLAALAAEVREVAERIGEPGAADPADPAASVRALLAWSYQNLSPAAAEMFRLLAVHPGPDISSLAAASLAGLAPSRAAPLLAELTGGHLLTEPASGRYAFHDLVRAFAAEQAGGLGEPARRAALARVLDHYLHTAHTASLLLNPGREPLALAPLLAGVTQDPLADYRQALAWFEAERHALLSAVTRAADTGFDVYAWQLAWALTDFLDWRGDWIDWAAINRIALSAATRLRSATGQAHASRLVAHNYARIGDYDQAHACLTDCLALCRQAGDRALEARVFLTLCWLCEHQLRHFEALAHAEQALALLRATGDQGGEAHALNNIGYCHLRLGDPRLARSYCEEALALYGEGRNAHGQAIAWDSLGEVEHHLGRHAESAACYQRSVRMLRDHGDRFREADTLIRLGDNYSSAGHPAEAEDAWQQALAILNDLHHPGAGRARSRLSQMGQF